MLDFFADEDTENATLKRSLIQTEVTITYRQAKNIFLNMGHEELDAAWFWRKARQATGVMKPKFNK